MCFSSKSCAMVIFWTNSLLLDIQNISNVALLQIRLYKYECHICHICSSVWPWRIDSWGWARLGGRGGVSCVLSSLFWWRLQTGFHKVMGKGCTLTTTWPLSRPSCLSSKAPWCSLCFLVLPPVLFLPRTPLFCACAVQPMFWFYALSWRWAMRRSRILEFPSWLSGKEPD